MAHETPSANTEPRTLSRRRFLGSAAAGAAMATVTVVPRHVLGGTGFTAPSETLVLAAIGLGGQGTGLSRRFSEIKEVRIAALCDVDDQRAGTAYERFPKARRFRDYRKLLDSESGIDGVLVATTDNLHAPVSMAAMRLGKHVYCEKPLTKTIREARVLAEAAREHGLATQMGNSGQASEATRRMAEFIAAGAVGTVREVHIWTDRPVGYWPQGVGRPAGNPAVPSTLDWDLWLGPAPERPYHPDYLPFVWRGWRDFGTGALGDMGCHAFHPVFRALDLGPPTSVVASSTALNHETFPLASIVRFRFPARGERPEIELTWYDGGLKPDWPEGMEEANALDSNGTLFVGDKGAMVASRRFEPVLFPAARRKEFEPPPKTLPRSIGHHEEWVRACKGGEPAGASFDIASLVTQTVLLGNIALSVDERGRTRLRDWGSRTLPVIPRLEWDAEKLEITNVPEANALVHREYRKGWTL